MPLPTRVAVWLAAIGAAASLGGCSGGKPQAAPPPSPSFSASPCPTPAATLPTAWPKELPADLPKPSHATIVGEQTTPDGIKIVRYTTPTSLRESVLFVVSRYPKAGYVLGRGDAEATEADAPFIHGTVRGITRLAALEQCKTLWLSATVKVTGPAGPTTPILPTHTSSGSPSPLPFG
jgi:hypothetical protein